MTRVPFAKPHASALQRVAHLRAKGLDIPRPNVAASKIEMIGYERLRIYFLSRRQPHIAGKPFLPNTSYRDVLRIYECDMRLREICFEAVGQFELLLRNAMSETLSQTYGGHPYYDVTAFRDAQANIDALKMFIDVYNRSKDRRARHYRDAYSRPVLPPIWTMKEFLTFGTSARILQTLSGQLRTNISKEFGVASDEVFTNWVECLVDLRNICAHHDRLFNRSFQKQPARLRSAQLPNAPSKSLHAVLECLDYMLTTRGSSTNTIAAVQKILTRYPEVRPAEAGF